MERIWFCLMKTSKITFKKIKGKRHIVSDDSSVWAIFYSLQEKESLFGLRVFPNLCLRGKCSTPAYTKDIDHKEALAFIFTRILTECSHQTNLELESTNLGY